MVKELRLEILALSFLLLFLIHAINTENGAKIEEMQRGAELPRDEPTGLLEGGL